MRRGRESSEMRAVDLHGQVEASGARREQSEDGRVGHNRRMTDIWVGLRGSSKPVVSRLGSTLCMQP